MAATASKIAAETIARSRVATGGATASPRIASSVIRTQASTGSAAEGSPTRVIVNVASAAWPAASRTRAVTTFSPGPRATPGNRSSPASSDRVRAPDGSRMIVTFGSARPIRSTRAADVRWSPRGPVSDVGDRSRVGIPGGTGSSVRVTSEVFRPPPTVMSLTEKILPSGRAPLIAQSPAGSLIAKRPRASVSASRSVKTRGRSRCEATMRMPPMAWPVVPETTLPSAMPLLGRRPRNAVSCGRIAADGGVSGSAGGVTSPVSGTGVTSVSSGANSVASRGNSRIVATGHSRITGVQYVVGDR